MIYVYLFALVVGGVVLGASLLLGGGAHDAAGGDAGEVGGGDVHTGADVAPHSDASHPQPAGAEENAPSGFEALLISVFSVRFWTFFLAFFGLTGIVFEAFGLVPWRWLTAVLAVAVGTISGSFAVWAVRKLGREELSSAVKSADYIGKTGRVLVGFSGDAIGKIRVEVKGTTIDLLAVSIEPGDFSPRDEVIVVEMDDVRARVARTRVSAA